MSLVARGTPGAFQPPVAQRDIKAEVIYCVGGVVTPIGGMVRRGRWSVERRLVFIAVIGGMNLDLREAQLTAPEVVVTAVSVIGGVNLIVPPGIRVEVDHFGLVGGRNIDTDETPEPDAPTVRLRAFAIIGGVKVRRTRLMDT
jgi:hypothetical protein